MKILELEQKYYEQVKDLLVDLQKYIIEIDKYNLNIISKDYREKYFEFMLDDCNSNQGKTFVVNFGCNCCLNLLHKKPKDKKLTLGLFLSKTP